MDVSDAKVILIFFGANFNASDKQVLEFSTIVLSGSSFDKSGKIIVGLNVEPGVPLSIFGLEGDESVGISIGHLTLLMVERKLKNEKKYFFENMEQVG